MTIKNLKSMLEHMPYFGFMRQDNNCFVLIEINENNFAYAQKNLKELMELSEADRYFYKLPNENRRMWVYFGYDRRTKLIRAKSWINGERAVQEYNNKACDIYNSPQGFIEHLIKHNGNMIPIVR